MHEHGGQNEGGPRALVPKAGKRQEERYPKLPQNVENQGLPQPTDIFCFEDISIFYDVNGIEGLSKRNKEKGKNRRERESV